MITTKKVKAKFRVFIKDLETGRYKTFTLYGNRYTLESLVEKLKEMIEEHL